MIKNDKENKDSSSDKEEEVNMDKPESSGVEKQNEDMENTEEHNDAEQCNLDKHKDNDEEDTTHLHKSLNRDMNDNSEIDRL